MGKTFNIFEVAGINHSEEIHTSIIADLINPNSKYHDYGDIFLKRFINEIKNATNLEVDDNFKKAEIKTEVNKNKSLRRIDMVIYIDDHVIPFEIKIWAGDQERQLVDYYNDTKAAAANDGKNVPAIIYLTPSGQKPSKKSRGDYEVYKEIYLMSFKNLNNWLEECLKVNPVDEVKEIIKQFKDNIDRVYKSAPRHEMLMKSIKDNLLNKHKIQGWTECYSTYITFSLTPLRKHDDLEFALRIKWEDNNKLKLLIICGEIKNMTPDYSNPSVYIRNNREVFLKLLNDTFFQPLREEIETAPSKWERYAKFICRRDNEEDFNFSELCCEEVVNILKNVNIKYE